MVSVRPRECTDFATDAEVGFATELACRHATSAPSSNSGGHLSRDDAIEDDDLSGRRRPAGLSAAFGRSYPTPFVGVPGLLRAFDALSPPRDDTESRSRGGHAAAERRVREPIQ